MPAPAVYVLAILGTVGAVIAFKEFVYGPHIAPRIDQWKAEYQAARKRRAETSPTQIALIQRGADKDGGQGEDDDDSHVESGKGLSTLQVVPVRPRMKNGLLIRQRSETTSDDWITGTSTAAETNSQQSDLRSRKNNGSLNEFILHPHFSPTTLPRTSRGESPSPTTTGPMPIELLELKKTSKTTETHTFLDQSIQAIPYTPLSPIRTPTPTHVLCNTSSTNSPFDSPFAAQVSIPLPEEALLLPKSKTDDSASHPSLASFQPLCVAGTTGISIESFPPRSPPGLVSQASNMATAPLLPVADIDSNVIPNGSLTPPHPIISPPDLALPSPLPSLPDSRTSPYQTPHIHPIPSLSQSYPLDDLLDYEHGLELLSPPSPLSRNDSPFELAGLSPRPDIGSTLLLARNGSGDRRINETPTMPVDNIARSIYLFSSPTLSAASSVSASSENGYENDFSQSEFSSTFSSPIVPPTRLGPGSPESNTQHPIMTFSNVYNNNHTDTQRFRPRNGTGSPWTVMNRTTTATTSTSSQQPFESAATHISRMTTSASDNGSELSDLDFLSMSAEEYGAFTLSPGAATGGSVGLGRPVSGRGGVVTGRVRGIDGSESDTSSWSLAGGSE